MLQLVGVTSYYSKTAIIRDVTLQVSQGSCLCVLGRNGVGKTTLLQTIMGLTTKMTGDLVVDHQNVSKHPTNARALAGLGYVPQGRRIFGKFSVRENIQLGMFARTDGKKEIPELCLELFPYLADNLDKRAGLLSGGQQQQLAIARALATNPKILLLDEPTEGIQPNVVDDIRTSLIRLNKEFGITIVLTEQSIKIARSMSDQFAIMDAGKVVQSGDIGDLTDEAVQKHLTI
jgi:urea transport system ATP-binding protein